MSKSAIVVGGGHAAAELSIQLREQGWHGSIEVFSDEPRLPYHRPPLSKAYLQGLTAADALAIRSQAAYDKAEVRFHPGCRVIALDAAQHTLTLADGTLRGFDALALATGARPRRPELTGLPAGAVPANLHGLRTLDDATAIRAACTPGSRLVLLGAGYIGLELAASARSLGAEVTVLEAQPRVLARVTGPEVADFLAAAHRAAGVDLRLSTGIAAVELDGRQQRVVAVQCSDGSRIDLDLLVFGIGVEPNVELARQAGLHIDNGIVVDEHARTSAPDIVAAGDCTSHPSALYGRMIRLESVPNALEQARTAAATLNGRARPYRQAPWFWSDQFDLKIKTAGLWAGADRRVVRGSPDARNFSVFYLDGDRILAVDTINRAPDFLAAKRIVGEDLRIDPARLADDSCALKDLLPPPPAA